jgi:hypothetical protein
MKNRVTISYFFAIAFCVFGLAATLHKICTKVCAIRYISYSFDSQLSANMCAAIEKQVALLEYDGQYQPSVIMQDLLRIFPEIKQIEIRSLPYNMAEISIVVPDPVVQINDFNVLTENRTIISSDFYACHVLEHLPKVQVASGVYKTVSKEVMAAIKHSIKVRLFDHFMVRMQDEQEWYLQDKKDPSFTICCNASCLPVGDIRELCDQLKETVKKNNTTKIAWVADVRFDHQIVLSRYKGGRNGKGIQ